MNEEQAFFHSSFIVHHSSLSFHVFQNLAARVRARCAGDAAAGVRARAAEVETANGRTVLCPTDDGAEGEELIERHLAVKGMSAREVVGAVEVERRDRLALDGQIVE